MNEFDYKKLLIAYINHIVAMEGITYIRNFESYLKNQGLSDEEIEHLYNLLYA